MRESPRGSFGFRQPRLAFYSASPTTRRATETTTETATEAAASGETHLLADLGVQPPHIAPLCPVFRVGPVEAILVPGVGIFPTAPESATRRTAPTLTAVPRAASAVRACAARAASAVRTCAARAASAVRACAARAASAVRACAATIAAPGGPLGTHLLSPCLLPLDLLFHVSDLLFLGQLEKRSGSLAAFNCAFPCPCRTSAFRSGRTRSPETS